MTVICLRQIMDVIVMISLLLNFFCIEAQDIVFPDRIDDVLRKTSVSTRQRFSGVASSSCFLPTGEDGDCLPYRECRELQRLVARSGLVPSTVRTLRTRICSVSNGRYKLCCKKPGTRPLVTTIGGGTGGTTTNNANIIPTINQCGLVTGTRITQGTETKIGEHPWLVGLGRVRNGKFQISCGGTLITRRHVLSASHCFLPPAVVTHVQLGEHSLTRDNEPNTPFTLRIVSRKNPGYNSRTHEKDLELLQLERDVEFTSFVKPLCLPFEFKTEDFVGEKMTIVGWGDEFFTSLKGTDIPLKATVSIVDKPGCRQAYAGRNIGPIDRQRLCATSETFDACQGDSGGPLIYDGKRSFLMGVISLGVDCASGKFPGIYTHVPSFVDWIQQNL